LGEVGWLARRVQNYLSRSNNSLVERTLTRDCCLNPDSSDQIGELNTNANAKYGSSLVCPLCGEILFASAKNPAYTFFENNSIFLSSKDNKNTNERLSILPYFIILSLSDINSTKANSGEINLQPEFDNSSMIFLLTESLLKNENKIQASTLMFLAIFLSFADHSINGF